MLVLDEQLLGHDLDTALARWYRGPVLFITDLRPGTVIKDDAIPLLLRQQHQATFLTINESDFWRKVAIDAHFCVVCFAVPDSRARESDTAKQTMQKCASMATLRQKAVSLIVRKVAWCC